MVAQLAGRTAARRFAVNQNHDINVTPFIDVMLVLLIVFIIAAPLATTAINVDIASGGVGPGWTPPVSVMIDDRGGISIRSASVGTISSSLDDLARDLARAARSAGLAHSWIVVSGASHTRYGAFMAVFDRLHADGFTKVTLAGKPA
jgi:biopolymer transport protein ExbD